jgi:prepilin signal peptidase PulO-like enzyme (type II secretory pathway)
MIWTVVWTVALLVAAAIDLRERRIPNWLTYGGTALAVAVAALDGRQQFRATLVGAGVALLFFGAIFALGLLTFRNRGGALGLGDVKLATFIGASCAWPVAAPALLAGILCGGLAALINILWHIAKRSYRPGGSMAYGPYLALGGLAGLWAGDALLASWQAIGR